jgi:hypothetical protein
MDLNEFSVLEVFSEQFADTMLNLEDSLVGSGLWMKKTT